MAPLRRIDGTAADRFQDFRSFEYCACSVSPPPPSTHPLVQSIHGRCGGWAVAEAAALIRVGFTFANNKIRRKRRLKVVVLVRQPVGWWFVRWHFCVRWSVSGNNNEGTHRDARMRLCASSCLLVPSMHTHDMGCTLMMLMVMLHCPRRPQPTHPLTL